MNKVLYKEENKVNVKNHQFYKIEALRIIKTYGGKQKYSILKSRELIDQIISSLMMADWRWESDKNPEKPTLQSTYRINCGKWAMYTIAKDSKNIKNKNINNINLLSLQPSSNNDIKNIENRDYIDNLLSKLNDMQERCIRMYYFDGMKQTEIAKQLSLSHQAINQHINKGLLKLKKMIEEENE